MDVGLGHQLDDQALLIRQLQIAVDVTFGIDEDRSIGRLASDQISVLRQAGIVDLVEMHSRVLLARLTRTPTEPTAAQRHSKGRVPFAISGPTVKRLQRRFDAYLIPSHQLTSCSNTRKNTENGRRSFLCHCRQIRHVRSDDPAYDLA